MGSLIPLLLAPAGCCHRLACTSSGVPVCRDPIVLEGVDVSSHEPNVNWSEVKRSGRVFAFARFSYGLELDTEFEANWGKMKKAGLVRGAYQYFRPRKNAAKQAKLIADWYNEKLSRGELGPGDLPVTLDIEDNECRSRAGLACQNDVVAYMDTVGRAHIAHEAGISGGV